MHFLHLSPPDLRERNGPTCVMIPQGQGATQVLAYFRLTLGREMALRALWFPKVGGQRRFWRISGSP